MEVRYSNIVQILPVKNRADLTVNRAQNPVAAQTSAKSSPISFQGAQNTILRKTVNSIDEIYALYKTSLEEVPFKYIAESVDILESQTGHSRKDVLAAMQHLTNFSNIRSVMNIAKILERDNISSIFNHKRFFRDDTSKKARDIMSKNSGLHNTFEYMIENKEFGNLNKYNSKKIAFFLDKKNIELLEQLKKECPEDFLRLKNSKNIRFYYLVGWDSGVTFVNRTKKLETQTRKLLELSDKTGLPIDTAANAPSLERIRHLGISPTTISQEGMPTEVCIYNRLAPEKMTKAELTNLIIANSEIRSKNATERFITQETATEYLDNNLKVFTPESLSTLSVDLRVKVNNFAKVKGIDQKNILYVEPDVIKSNSYISYMYKNINNIPDEQFITLDELKKKDKDFLDDKLAVFLDDCTITGNSINDMIFMDISELNKEAPKLFVCYGATANAKHVICNSKNKENNIHLIVGDYIPHVLTGFRHIFHRQTEKAVGRPNYIKGEATCLVFPYMSPDTNTELAANIALLHNTNYRLSNIMVPHIKRNYMFEPTDPNGYEKVRSYKHRGVKNYTPTADRIAKKSNSLTGSTPTILETNPCPKRESFADRLYRYLFCKD